MIAVPMPTRLKVKIARIPGTFEVDLKQLVND